MTMLNTKEKLIGAEALKRRIGELHFLNYGMALIAICEAPAVDAVEVVHGQWIPTYHTYHNKDGTCQIADEWHCSECEIFSQNKWNYCPNCGAKMDGGENNGKE